MVADTLSGRLSSLWEMYLEQYSLLQVHQALLQVRIAIRIANGTLDERKLGDGSGV